MPKISAPQPTSRAAQPQGLRGRLPGCMLATVLACLVAWGLPARAAEYPWRAASAFWEPYVYDQGTDAIYHLDEAAPVPVATELPSMDALGGGDLGALLGGDDAAPAATIETTAQRPADSAANANPVGEPATLRGSATFVKTGRLHGGVRFDGGDGRLALPDFGEAPARTLEFWVRLEALPKSPAVLAWITTGNAEVARQNRNLQPVVWRLLPTGAIELSWEGEPLPGMAEAATLQPGVWTHLALTWSRVWPIEDVALLQVNGKEVWRHDFKRNIYPATHFGLLTLGNDLRGEQGWAGDLDEVRLSRVSRDYYPLELGWVDPSLNRAASESQLTRDPADLLFYLPFDDGKLAPQVAAPGTSSPKPTLRAEDQALQPARFEAAYPLALRGRGLQLGGDGQRPVYSAQGNFFTDRGSVAFWLKPGNWDNFARDNKLDQTPPTAFTVFNVNGEYAKGSWERKFKRDGPLLSFFVTLHLPENVDAPVPLHPGTWTHVVANWVGTEVRWFINGELRDPESVFQLRIENRDADGEGIKTDPRWWAQAKPETIAFTPHIYWPAERAMPLTTIDEFRIYRRPLSASEVANVMAIGDPRREVQALPALDLAIDWNGVLGRVDASVTALRGTWPAGRSVHVSVHRVADSAAGGAEAGGDADAANAAVAIATPLAEADAEFDAGGHVELRVATPPLDFASYEVRAQARDAAGQPLGEPVTRHFTRVAPPWWGSKAGLSDTVPPPWEPVTVEGNVIHVWGRELYLAPSGLPASVVSQGEMLLGAPALLEVTVAGELATLEPTAEAVAIGPVTETRAEAEGTLRGPGFTVRTHSSTEFDGMSWFTVTLTPEAGQTPTIDALRLTLPYLEESAEIMHWWSGDREFRDPKVVGIGPPGHDFGTLFSSADPERITHPPTLRGNFIPYVMLTGMRTGMAWFAENDRGWTQSDTIPAVSLHRDATTCLVELRLQIIAEPVVLDAPLQFSFGLHPTPIRPLPSRWRLSPPYSNVLPDTFTGNNLKGRRGPSTFNTYIEDDWEAVQRRIDGEGLTPGAAGLKSLAAREVESFTKTWGRPPHSSEVAVPGLYWDMQWTGQHPAHTREWTEAWGLGHGDFQHYDQAFIDYCAWAWDQWLTHTNGFVRGLYIDDCWPAPQALAHGPVAYILPDGHVQPGFQFRGYRERFKRTRQLYLDHGLEPQTTAHITHTLYAPYASFFDLLLDGEDHYQAPPDQKDFLDYWPLARLRFMHNAKWGIPTTWLGWHGNSLDTDKWPAWTYRHERAYTAAMLLHDIRFPVGLDVARDFGLRLPDTVQIPYWADQGLSVHSHVGLQVGAWKRDGKALVILVNTTDTRIEAEVSLNAATMGFGNRPAERLNITQRDPTLLSYFETDVTTIKQANAPTDAATTDDATATPLLDGLALEADPADQPLDERRAKDPDGAFSWENGTLRCPIRPHDYRLFEFE